jgi:hypothetical protein
MRLKISILTSTMIAASVLLVGPHALPAAAVGGSTNACELVPVSKLKSILGLSNVFVEKNEPAHHYPQESDGKAQSTCYGLAWSGPKPTSHKQAEEKLANGSGAEWSWETYATDTAAPPEDVASWVGPTTVNGKPDPGEYTDIRDSLEGGGLKELIAALKYLHGLQGGPFFPPHLGAEASGGYEARIPAKGVLSHVRGAGAYWTDESSHSIIEITIVQGKHASAVKKKLEKVAKIAVPAFGL